MNKVVYREILKAEKKYIKIKKDDLKNDDVYIFNGTIDMKKVKFTDKLECGVDKFWFIK